MSIINLYRSAYTNSHDAITVNEHIAVREALPELDFENSVIAVNGFEADENYILRDDDICTIRVFPKGAGGAIDAAFAAIATLINPLLGLAWHRYRNLLRGDRAYARKYGIKRIK